MSSANRLKRIVNEYVEWLRNGAHTMTQVKADIKGRCFMPHEREFIEHWVKVCMDEGRYL